MSKTILWSKVDEGINIIYYVGDNGQCIKRSHKLKRESFVKPHLHSTGHVQVKINGVDYRLKNLVAQHYIKEWKPGVYVECIDGDPFNCNVKNLRLYTQSEHGKRTAPQNKSRAVVIQGRKYKSVRQAARMNYVSYQTLLDYLTPGAVKHSVLQGIEAYYL